MATNPGSGLIFGRYGKADADKIKGLAAEFEELGKRLNSVDPTGSVSEVYVASLPKPRTVANLVSKTYGEVVRCRYFQRYVSDLPLPGS